MKLFNKFPTRIKFIYGTALKFKKVDYIGFSALIFSAYITILRPGYLCIKGPTVLMRDPATMKAEYLSGYKNEVVGILQKGELFEYVDFEQQKSDSFYKGWYRGRFVYVEPQESIMAKPDFHFLWKSKRQCD